MSEVDLMRAIQVHLSRLGHRVFRNNVAIGWVGVMGGRTPTGTVTLHRARPLHAGLCVGSSDLIGWTKDGLILAVEVKTASGVVSDEQEQFIRIVRQSGGRAGIARSTEDAENIANGNAN